MKDINYEEKLKTVAGYIGHMTDTDILDKDFKTFLMLLIPKAMRIELYKEMMQCLDDNCGAGCVITPQDLELKDSDVEGIVSVKTQGEE